MTINKINGKEEYCKRRRSFFDDAEIGPELDKAKDDKEMSTIIRMAVRHWYGFPTAAAPPRFLGDPDQLRDIFLRLIERSNSAQ